MSREMSDKKETALFTTLMLIWCLSLVAGVPLLMLIFTGGGISSTDNMSFSTDLTYDNAPEGTYYVDVLLKMDTSDDNYTDFNAAPQCYIRTNAQHMNEYAELPVNSGSEIAKYNEKGYVSLLSHCKGAQLFIYDSEYNEENEFRDDPAMLSLHDTTPYVTISTLYSRCGRFKVAYVDKNGNILGVTDKSKKKYDSHKNYSLAANGNALTFTVSRLSPLRTVLLYTYVIGSPLLTVMIPLIMVAITIVKAKRNRREADSTAAENPHKELEKN